MSEAHYQGGCQCGAVRYEVDIDLDDTVTCNCSRCKPMGFVLGFTPRDNFTLVKGQDATSDYRFNTGKIEHKFCATCGVESFAYGEQDGKKMVAINANCLDGVDARALKSTPYDGASVGDNPAPRDA